MAYQPSQLTQGQMAQNNPTAAFVLSLLGGIFGLLGAIAFVAWGGGCIMCGTRVTTTITRVLLVGDRQC
jgi:hypothetical protein